MRSLWISLLFTLALHAQPVRDMTVGVWQIVTKSTSENHTHVTEKRSLWLKADHTLEILTLVNLKKGEHFIKDLQIKANGIWKRYNTTLVLVIQKIDVPVAKEVSRTITQRSLKSLAATYQAHLRESPIHIDTITFLDHKKLTIIDEKGVETTYIKKIAPKSTHH